MLFICKWVGFDIFIFKIPILLASGLAYICVYVFLDQIFTIGSMGFECLTDFSDCVFLMCDLLGILNWKIAFIYGEFFGNISFVCVVKVMVLL